MHIHRIGRTARAGSKGLAFSLYSHFDKKNLNQKINFESLDSLNSNNKAILVPKMATLRISCGRKNKLRAGDILGALTANKNILGNDVGKIDICDTHSFVAVTKAKVSLALSVLTQEKIKGKILKVIILS